MEITTITLELVYIVSSAVGVALGILFWANGQFTKRDSDIKISRLEASDKIYALQKEIADYKLTAAHTFSTKSEVNMNFDQVMASIEKLGARLDAFLTNKNT